MVELTPEQRRQIYEEEKSKYNSSGSNSADILLLLLSNAMAALILTGLIKLAKYDILPRLKDLRKAQTGVYTEE